MYSFFEFFAGGGMARAGLGEGWECLLANDMSEKKASSYKENWGGEHLVVADVNKIKSKDIPGHADMAWASFPCQDLSLAGAGAGIRAERSGTFWPFWNLVKGMVKGDRAPRLVVLENVCGALTSHAGKDFAAIGSALSRAGYRFGAVVLDAVDFLPQSRPRLFIVAVRSDVDIPNGLILNQPDAKWHSKALVHAQSQLTKSAAKKWLWWSLPAPSKRSEDFVDLIEDEPVGVTWHTKKETNNLLSMMTDVNKAKVTAAKVSGKKMVGGLYRRTRNGVQRAEVRFDGVAGCLRTPTGGSSRQTILIVEGKKVRSRLLSPREGARLMGLPDSYILPRNYNESYHLVGDGVAVPVVSYLAENLLKLILDFNLDREVQAA
ncbi:DNA (cytosine-5-)-methyltransferase [Gammaproteobacteria bacterium 42_54_T18]|nr:DNA (cytosine-5-)-methyltransferase [Gammaproteobacteria bacterium 42_54_T18]